MGMDGLGHGGHFGDPPSCAGADPGVSHPTKEHKLKYRTEKSIGPNHTHNAKHERNPRKRGKRNQIRFGLRKEEKKAEKRSQAKRQQKSEKRSREGPP